MVTIDPVGTKGKGEAYRKSHTYKRLGLQERDDMIAATRWIAKQCWADKSRISYWGWSYGGFMTSFVAAADTNLFVNLIAVAPVTSWTLHDSIYTERYMLRPQDNPPRSSPRPPPTSTRTHGTSSVEPPMIMCTGRTAHCW